MTKLKLNLGAILAVFFIILLLQFTGWGKNLGSASARLISPLEGFFYRLGVSVTSFANYRLLLEENAKLKEELSKLSIDYIKLQDLTSENEYLKRELDYLQVKKFQFQLAGVIGVLPSNSQVLILNRGSISGLAVGQAATVNQGIIVGKIIQVEENRSFVQLLTDTRSQLAVTLSDLPGSNGLLKGQAGNSLLMDLIPQDKQLATGDLVISSGLEENIPRGLLVGSITEVGNLVGQIFKTARVNPPFSYQSLQIITIIKSY